MMLCDSCSKCGKSEIVKGSVYCIAGNWNGKPPGLIEACTDYDQSMDDAMQKALAEVSSSALVVVEALGRAVYLLRQVECPYNSDGHKVANCKWCHDKNMIVEFGDES